MHLNKWPVRIFWDFYGDPSAWLALIISCQKNGPKIMVYYAIGYLMYGDAKAGNFCYKNLLNMCLCYKLVFNLF